MGSKQEKRLAKGLKAQAKADAAEAARMEADIQANGGEALPGMPVEEVNKVVEEILAEDNVQELPELVPEQPQPEAPQAEPEAPKPASAGPVLHVKQGLPLRGGRGEWYKLLCKYDGKPVADYIAEGKAHPASHYTARSTKCGQPKTPESRLSWFKRAGIVTIS